MRIPTATYRLQFNENFTLSDALKLVPYLDSLGISDIYCSPLFKSRSGSSNGYEIVDYSQIDPKVGSEEELKLLAMALQKRGMGLILDIVPNHMSISEENSWWRDVLEHGRASLYSEYFNIVWNPPKTTLNNKVLLPVLEKPFIEELENGKIHLIYDENEFWIAYKGRKFPVNPSTYSMILSGISKKSPQLQIVLRDLEFLPSSDEIDLEMRLKRLHEWNDLKSRFALLVKNDSSFAKELDDEINNTNGQIGDPKSFDRLENVLKEQSYHLCYWEMGKEEANYQRFFDVTELVTLHAENPLVFEETHALVFKWIDRGWVTGLRVDHIDGLYDPSAYVEKLQKRCGSDFYILVEKILMKGESLPPWPISGTTGYDFLNTVNLLLVQKENKDKFEKIFDKFTGKQHDLSVEIIQSKKLVLTDSMASNLYLLASQLDEIAQRCREAHDYTSEDLKLALKEIMASMPVYRTYFRPDGTGRSEEWAIIMRAIQNAKNNLPSFNPLLFDFIGSLFTQFEKEFVMKFQQLTGPVTAKGWEDTALYRVFPLSSLNEVGMDPLTFGIDAEEFHPFNEQRLMYWPHTLNATSTHDNKRDEDVRARIAALSEDPEGWQNALSRWRQLNRNHPFSDPAEEYLFYQTVIGTWTNEEESKHYIDRIEDYMIKAIREAKIHSGWSKPDAAYEENLRQAVRAVLKKGSPFIKDLQEFIHPLQKAGFLNSLLQILLKITLPGIPDFYQGTEFPEFHLVDPDNRHPVDYSKDDNTKIPFIKKLLNFRKNNSKLFNEGDYIPLEVQDPKVIAFCRKHQGKTLIVVTGRFFLKGNKKYQFSISKDLQGKYLDILTGKNYDIKPESPVPFTDFLVLFR